jgi:hypothetical protein
MFKNTRDYDGKAIGVFQVKKQNKHGNKNYNIDTKSNFEFSINVFSNNKQHGNNNYNIDTSDEHSIH